MILPEKYGSVYSKRLICFYNTIYKKRFGEYPRVKYSPLFYVMLKRAFVKYGEIKLASAILVHFQQNGARIQEEKFPFVWLFKNIDQYLLFLQDEIGLNIDKDEELYLNIKNRINYLAIEFDM